MLHRFITCVSLVGVLLHAASLASAAPIRVAATVPELGSLAKEIGGDQLSVEVFAKGTEDPHYLEAKPSFITTLSRADLYMQIGMDLEVGWAPLLLQNARNGRVQPGASGYLDASVAIAPLEVPTGFLDRTMGDVHPLGNPHYLTDPLEGLSVAALIRDRLAEIRPEKRTYFEQRYDQFAQRLAEALIGAELAQKYGVDGAVKLARLHRVGRLISFLKSQGEETLLGGWLGIMSPHYGVRAVDDHNMWPYFARAFGIDIIGHMEPKPGIPPSTRHLKILIERMQAEQVKLILTSADYDPKHAEFVSRRTGATVVPLANQVGARKGADDYLSMVEYNVKRVAAALSKETEASGV